MSDYGTFPSEERIHGQRGDGSSTRRPLLAALCISSVFLTFVAFLYSAKPWSRSHGGHEGGGVGDGTGAQPDMVLQVQTCTSSNLRLSRSVLNDVRPIHSSEFLSRRDRLAKALIVSDVDAFALEPGFAFQYYGNVSQTDWEPWEPEERPFLMLVLPQRDVSTGEVIASTAFLAPHFEEGRVRMLGVPSREGEELDIVVWEEHWDPYETLIESRLFKASSDLDSNNTFRRRRPKIMVDEEVRDFISRGLTRAGFETVGLSQEVELVRQIKSPAEIEILRAVNTATVEAVRAMRPCLAPGLTENQVRDILDAALLSLGFEPFFDIVLFEEHGALPHGGFVTGWKRLRHDTMVVIDVGVHYLGYSSDICRSFFIDPPDETKTKSSWLSGFVRKRPKYYILSEHHDCRKHADPDLCAEKLKIWYIVLGAQTRAMEAMEANSTAASVDVAAREYITESGYGSAFTHRVGHGIGIKAHESPYLNKWNTGVRLRPGMVFTNEPGVYLEGKFGVRLEDVFLVREDGQAEILSGKRATTPYDL